MKTCANCANAGLVHWFVALNLVEVSCAACLIHVPRETFLWQNPSGSYCCPGPPCPPRLSVSCFYLRHERRSRGAHQQDIWANPQSVNFVVRRVKNRQLPSLPLDTSKTEMFAAVLKIFQSAGGRIDSQCDYDACGKKGSNNEVITSKKCASYNCASKGR